MKNKVVIILTIIFFVCLIIPSYCEEKRYAKGGWYTIKGCPSADSNGDFKFDNDGWWIPSATSENNGNGNSEGSASNGGSTNTNTNTNPITSGKLKDKISIIDNNKFHKIDVSTNKIWNWVQSDGEWYFVGTTNQKIVGYNGWILIEGDANEINNGYFYLENSKMITPPEDGNATKNGWRLNQSNNTWEFIIEGKALKNINKIQIDNVFYKIDANGKVSVA